MPSRRGFLGALAAATLIPRPSWADVGSPAYLAAARLPDGSFALCGLDGSGHETFAIPLPDRGHAAAAHPTRPEAVAFARRPGRFALVIDCVSGDVTARLEAPVGRHFYGHGVFSRDGDTLYTTENDFAAGEGRIGIWSRADGYARIGEFASGGTGPHDMKRMPGSDVLVIANGGIETHPDRGREKLNLAVMQPNLSYLGADGTLLETVELPPEHRLNSIRHLAMRGDGLVGFAMQWQGDVTQHPPLIGTHQMGGTLRIGRAEDTDAGRMQGYAGSVAFSRDGKQIAFTSPRGGACFGFDAKTLELVTRVDRPDVCGLASNREGLVLTDGLGWVSVMSDQLRPLVHHDKRQWDNHLVSLADLGD